ncbi:MAG: C_GCAxxG_C_C family protein [Desulfobacter sp.]|nr:MAG: C_GCAxxG_C_C family protein [Desulfobacter sp.]
MTDHTAVNKLLEGYSCSESILMAYAPYFDLPPELAGRLAAGFSGGFAQGKTCGAVTAATVVIGLKFGPGLTPDPYKKDLCLIKIQELFHRFEKRHYTTNCGKILTQSGVDPKDPEQIKQLRQKKICNKIVYDAAVILDDLLGEKV